MIGGLVFREGEDHPDMRLFLVPVSQVRQEDTWYCAGLRGSGSSTSVLDNVFVPAHCSVSFSMLRDACSPGSKLNTNPIYRTPFIAVHTYALLGPALGLARGGYEDFVQWTRQRYLTYTRLAIAQHVPVQIRIAQIAAQIDSAELLARRALATARQNYTDMAMETRTVLRRDFTYAMQTLREAMDALIKISGSSGLMDGNSVQRCWRDVHAILARCHELGCAGRKFREERVWARSKPGLSNVLGHDPVCLVNSNARLRRHAHFPSEARHRSACGAQSRPA